jgi:hypothetical protein
MRRLGSELGVEAMALYYYYFASKSAPDALCDKLFSELDLEPDPDCELSDRLLRGLISFRDALASTPTSYRW